MMEYCILNSEMYIVLIECIKPFEERFLKRYFYLSKDPLTIFHVSSI